MLNVVRFLEMMGSDAQWNEISMDKMELALTEAGIEGPARSAILNRDAAGLQVLLQQKEPICFVIPGEEEEEGEEEGEDELDKKGQRMDAPYVSHSSLVSQV
jgi:hypothetical protein